jgi:hypothetical protein
MKVQFCLFPMQKWVPWRFSFVYFQCKSWSHVGSVLSISNTKAGPMEVQFFLFPIQKLVPWRFSHAYFQCKSWSHGGCHVYFQYKSWSHEGSVFSISNTKAGPMEVQFFLFPIQKLVPWRFDIERFHWITNNCYYRFRFTMFNATFNNISVISWWSVLLMEETGVPGENHRQTLSHNVVSITPRLNRVRTHNLCGHRY